MTSNLLEAADNYHRVNVAADQDLEVAYHLMAEAATYCELGTDYFDRYRAQRLKRPSLESGARFES